MRPMGQADLAGVLAIERETLSPWSAVSLGRELAAPRSIQAVAVAEDGTIGGWIACRTVGPEAELMKIAVRQADRRQGLGQRLLDFLVGELCRQQVLTLFLEVRAANLAALNFYRKNGFRRVGQRAGYYGDPPDNALVLRKDLTASTEQ